MLVCHVRQVASLPTRAAMNPNVVGQGAIAALGGNYTLPARCLKGITSLALPTRQLVLVASRCGRCLAC